MSGIQVKIKQHIVLACLWHISSWSLNSPQPQSLPHHTWQVLMTQRIQPSVQTSRSLSLPRLAAQEVDTDRSLAWTALLIKHIKTANAQSSSAYNFWTRSSTASFFPPLCRRQVCTENNGQCMNELQESTLQRGDSLIKRTTRKQLQELNVQPLTRIWSFNFDVVFSVTLHFAMTAFHKSVFFIQKHVFCFSMEIFIIILKEIQILVIHLNLKAFKIR